MRRVTAAILSIVLCILLSGCATVSGLDNDVGNQLGIIEDLEASAKQESLSSAKNAVLEKDYATAATHFRDIVESEPENVDMRLWLGRCLLMTGGGQEAVDTLKEAEKLEPENTEVLKYLARAYESIGDTQTAIDTYLKLQALDPESPAVYLGLEQLYIATGDTEKLDALRGIAVSTSEPEATLPPEENISYDMDGNPVYDDEWPDFQPNGTENLWEEEYVPSYDIQPVITPEPTPQPTAEVEYIDPDMPKQENESGWDEYGG